MALLKSLLVIGTRPEAIKLAPVVYAIAESGWLKPCMVATAQHRHLLDQVLEEFALDSTTTLIS